MGNNRSKPLSEEETAAFAQFYEQFKGIHTYLNEDEMEQNAIYIWETMTPDQKSQFLNNKESVRVHIEGVEYTPRKHKIVSKVKPKLTTKPKHKTTEHKTRIVKASNKTVNTVNSNTKGKPWKKLPIHSKNTFRNFIREFRRRNGDLDSQTALKLAAKTWRLLYRDDLDILKKMVGKKRQGDSLTDVNFMYL